MLDISRLKQIFESEKEKNYEDFFTFLRFKSISTDPNYRDEVEKCATWLAEYLQSIGLDVETWQTQNAPIIFGSNLDAGPEKETLLIYCHYDVQPVDPLEEWLSPPFEPTTRDGEVYARGTSDNKGQCFYTLLAIKALLEELGKLPVNLKFVIEGEEESGSFGLSQLLEEKKESLAANYLLIVDSGFEKIEEPAITLGARGLVCLEVTVQEAQYDLHSGMVGGMAYNPNRALVEMLSKLHDERGSIAINGFYDEMVEIPPHEKKELSFNFDPGYFFSLFGFEPTGMECDISPLEANWLRPTIEINGMWGGYTESGVKTVIPATAHAKLSCRLVPQQNPDRIAVLVRDFLISNTPHGLQTKVQIHHGNGRGFRTHPNSRIVQLMSESYTQIFQKPCQKILIGGSIPIAAELSEAAKAEMVLVGLSLPGDHVHAPNEHFGLDRLEKGFQTICRALELFK